ncbi:hypothetical protein ES708_33479 [subsurface metagenome]
MTGITDADFGGDLSGYGLYSTNIYLKGSIIASGGIIGGWVISTTSIYKVLTGYYGLYIHTVGNGTTIGKGLTLLLNETDPGKVREVGVGQLHNKDSYDTLSSDYGFEIIKQIEPTVYKHIIRMGGSDIFISGWKIDFDAIYTGTKKISDGFSNSGITLAADGSIHAKQFYINSDGAVGLKTKEITTGIRGGLQIEGNNIYVTYDTDISLEASLVLNYFGGNTEYSSHRKFFVCDGYQNEMFSVLPDQDKGEYFALFRILCKYIQFENIPTSVADVSQGQIYNDNGDLKIKI